MALGFSKFFVLMLVVLGSRPGFAQNPTETSNQNNDLMTFIALLKEYKNYPEFFSQLAKGRDTFNDITEAKIKSLPEKSLEARYKSFNADYRRNLRIKDSYFSQLNQLKDRLNSLPLSNYAQRADLELKHRSMTDTYNQIRRIIFLSSVNANSSIVEANALSANNTGEATTTGPNTAPASKAKKSGIKMPGVFGGDLQQRLQLSEQEKINLTPVDDAFYSTQLGKKLESDLGGRADSWSYDYEKDDLYIKVGDEVGKIRVVDQGPGLRFIQTRVGSGYREPAGADTKVDMLEAKGRFLTGDDKEESLFGLYPSGDPKTLSEGVLPAGHSKDDGHNHDH